jgi:ribosome biogenesis protein UTP30
LFENAPDICYFIRDKGAHKSDQSENIREFEGKLAEANITGVKTIMPLTQLKNDYKNFSMKIKLCNTYDLFFVEQEIADHVNTILGKEFLKKRKRPHMFDSQKPDIMKIKFDAAQRKIAFKLSESSSVTVFEVGTMKMDNSKIADNVMAGLEQLKEKWPGGWRNISRLFLKPMKPSKVSIPIFYTKINPNDVEVPVIVGHKYNRVEKLAKKLEKKSKKLQLLVDKKQIVKAKNNPADKLNKKSNKKNEKKKAEESADGAKNDENQNDKKRKIKNEENKSSEIASVEQQQQQPLKKKKKKNAEPESNLNSESATVNVMETTEKKIKKKKKNVEKPVTEENNESNEKNVSPEKEQKSKKNKKVKKNKA